MRHIETKKCTKCQLELPTTEFRKDSRLSSGLRANCKNCQSVSNNARYAVDKEKILETNRIRYQKDREKRLQEKREYYLRNKEMLLAKNRKWRLANPDRKLGHNRKRRALQKNAYSEPYSTEDVLNTWGSDCYLCGGAIDLIAPRHPRFAGWELGLQIDHVIQLGRGGEDTIKNVRPTHALCNFRRPK